MRIKNGFGLIEVLVVVVVLGIIASASYVYVNRNQTEEVTPTPTPFDSITDLTTTIEDLLDVDVAQLIENEDGSYALYSIYKNDISNVGGEKIGEFFDWYLLNTETQESSKLNEREIPAGADTYTPTVYEVLGWHDNTTIVVRDGSYLEVSYQYLFDILEEVFTVIPDGENYQDYILLP